jgi:hypothetical protein
MVGCAHGVDPEPDTTPQTEVEENIPAPRPAPVETYSPPEDDRDCQVDSYWVNTCLVTKVYCDGKLVRMDVKCTRDRPLFPWEYIPDPPPYDSQKNDKN